MTTQAHDRIRDVIDRAGLRQADVAEALGLTQPAVSRRLNGHTDWTLGELRVVAALAGVPVADLVTEAA